MIFTTLKTAHREVAKGTYEVTFARPEHFTFLPGQYTQVAVSKLDYTDPKGRSRQFSIATPPHNRNDIAVVFRDSGSGFKRTLIKLPIGAPVVIEQGAGSFLLPLTPTKPVVLVAGGVGISPFMSYLRELSFDSLKQPITLLYGNQNPESAAYLKELTELSKRQKQLSLRCLYTQPTPDLFTSFTKRHRGATWFVVGPPPMVATTIHGLQAGGISRDHIVSESFDGY